MNFLHIECLITHWTFFMHFDSRFYAIATENVTANCWMRLIGKWWVQTNGTFHLIFTIIWSGWYGWFSCCGCSCRTTVILTSVTLWQYGWSRTFIWRTQIDNRDTSPYTIVFCSYENDIVIIWKLHRKFALETLLRQLVSDQQWLWHCGRLKFCYQCAQQKYTYRPV